MPSVLCLEEVHLSRWDQDSLWYRHRATGATEPGRAQHWGFVGEPVTYFQSRGFMESYDWPRPTWSDTWKQDFRIVRLLGQDRLGRDQVHKAILGIHLPILGCRAELQGFSLTRSDGHSQSRTSKKGGFFNLGMLGFIKPYLSKDQSNDMDSLPSYGMRRKRKIGNQTCLITSLNLLNSICLKLYGRNNQVII